MKNAARSSSLLAVVLAAACGAGSGDGTTVRSAVAAVAAVAAAPGVGPADAGLAGRRHAPIGPAAYELLLERVNANRERFHVYEDADSGFNHGFPSGLFGAIAKIDIDAGCVAAWPAGCSSDPAVLDTERGTVFRITFDPLAPGEFAGVNFEEPEHWGVLGTGDGYDLTGATRLVLEASSPGGASVQFGVGGSVTPFVDVPAGPGFVELSFPFAQLSPPLTAIDDVHRLLTVVTNDVHAPNGATVLLDEVRFEPVPDRQETDEKALSFPLGTETFGALALDAPAGGCWDFPLDQVVRNLTTIYESGLVANALADRGTAADLAGVARINDTFGYALRHENQGAALPAAPDGSVGLHSGYEGGDVALQNDQGAVGVAKAGEVRLAGFTASFCTPTSFCLVLDGATGGNDCFAVLALLRAYQELGDPQYLLDALTISNWIVQNLEDPDPSGFGGYFLGYPDGGVAPTLIPSKSIENNADVFAAFTALAEIVGEPGATYWRTQAAVAGDFVMAMYDPSRGRFHAGTVPAGTPPGPGIQPDGPQMGNDVINTFDFLDANTFSVLAMASVPPYSTLIDWRLPIHYVLATFGQTATAAGETFHGFSIVAQAHCGHAGIAWEFTGQVVVAMRHLDELLGTSEFTPLVLFYLDQLARARDLAPFADGRGLVASTLQGGDAVPPLEQCLATPFQCIPERVGLAATTWAIFAERGFNPLDPLE